MKSEQLMKIEDIFEALKLSQTIAADILFLLKEENEAIQGMATNTLIRLSKRKEDLLAKSHFLDQKIVELIGEFIAGQGAEGGLIPGEGRLAAVIPFIPENQAEVLNKYRSNLRRYRAEILQRNLVNKRLTADTLGYINDAINVMTQQPDTPTYGNRGVAAYVAQNPAMISREV